MGFFKMGRQAQMMPTLTSTLDQRVGSMVPYVVSGFLEPDERVVMRKREAMQTLYVVGQRDDLPKGTWGGGGGEKGHQGK